MEIQDLALLLAQAAKDRQQLTITLTRVAMALQALQADRLTLMAAINQAELNVEEVSFIMRSCYTRGGRVRYDVISI